jgi:hypothetical protein
MKKYIYKSILALLFASAFSSCDLDAPTQSATDESVLYSNYALTEPAVIGICNSFASVNSYRGRFLPYYGINTDVEWINNMPSTGTGLADDDKYELAGYAARPTNKQMNTQDNAWAAFYEGIERANLCIRGLRAYGNVENDRDMAQLLGEALTLRAVLYLDLVKGWGDVPARFEPINSETLYIPRSDRDVIYKQLLADLKEAEFLVSWPNERTVTSTTERINTAFVKALRARVALYAGGYSQRADGTRLSNDPELSQDKMYTIAKEECLDVINHQSNELGTFKENFEKLCKDVITAGGESLWEIPFNDDPPRGRVVYTLGVLHNAVDQYTKQPKGGVNGPLPILFYDYDVDDVRRDITCVPYDWSSSNPSKQQLRSLKSGCFGKLRYDWMNRYVESTNDDCVNWQYMRLADVYLMAAEAINYLEGPSNAAQYMKLIVDLALPAAKAAAYMAGATASKNAFQNAIVDQRAFEFAGESLRKADLIRWNLLDSKLAEAKVKMTQLRDRQGAYADLPEKLYYKINETDKESLIIYGLNHGETDAIGATLNGYDSEIWIKEDKLTDALINALYQKDPNANQFWPIWQTFISSSNGMLTND